MDRTIMTYSPIHGKSSAKRSGAPKRTGSVKHKDVASNPASVKAIGQTAPGVYVISLMSDLTDKGGTILVDRVARDFGMSKMQLAQTAGLNQSVVHKPARLKTRKSQNRMREMLEIVGRVMDWAGSKEQGMAWYRAQPIPAFGGRTAESLVKDGKAAAVRDYLDSIALGGFA
jgi:ribosome-binding protein aMBF1 (putative translation factor)